MQIKVISLIATTLSVFWFSCGGQKTMESKLENSVKPAEPIVDAAQITITRGSEQPVSIVGSAHAAISEDDQALLNPQIYISDADVCGGTKVPTLLFHFSVYASIQNGAAPGTYDITKSSSGSKPFATLSVSGSGEYTKQTGALTLTRVDSTAIEGIFDITILLDSGEEVHYKGLFTAPFSCEDKERNDPKADTSPASNANIIITRHGEQPTEIIGTAREGPNLLTNTFDPYELQIFISNGDECGGNHDSSISISFLVYAYLLKNGAVPGVYPISNTHSSGSPPLPASFGATLDSQFYNNPKSGTLTLTRVDSNGAEGYFDVTVGGDDGPINFSGSFSAPFCP
jgi:hypothetical protein